MVRGSGKLSFHIRMRSSAGRSPKDSNNVEFVCKSFKDSVGCGKAAESYSPVFSGRSATAAMLSLVSICVVSIFLGDLQLWSDAEVVQNMFCAHELPIVLTLLISGTSSCVCVVRLSSSLGDINQD